MNQRPDILCISSIDWDFIWQGHQEIMSRLAADGHRVLFIENTGVRRPSVRDISRVRKRAANWAHFRGHLNEVECVVVGSADAFEARAFMSANPTARVYPRRLGATSVLVIMNGEPAE